MVKGRCIQVAPNMIQEDVTVLHNQQIAEECYQMALGWHRAGPAPEPGQFITVKVTDSTDPLLRRPFAFASFDGETNATSIIYQVRGKGTRSMAALKKGDTINVLGPLGNSFPAPPPGSVPVLVAGGVGIGPVIFLENELRSGNRDPLLVIGALNRERLPRLAPQIGGAAIFCTDDGSVGFHGTVTDYIRTLSSGEQMNPVFYACGPEGMLISCAALAAEKKAKCWVSLEQTMGCGVGACMGCVIRVKSGNGFARVCSEGSVFDAEEVLWK